MSRISVGVRMGCEKGECLLYEIYRIRRCGVFSMKLYENYEPQNRKFGQLQLQYKLRLGICRMDRTPCLY